MTQRSNIQSKTNQTYYYGTGKRKTAIAQVRLYPDGDIKAINGRPFESVLPLALWQTVALEPLSATGNLERFSVIAKLRGGGISAWSHALRHGIARALLVYDPNLRPFNLAVDARPIARRHLVDRISGYRVTSSSMGLDPLPHCGRLLGHTQRNLEARRVPPLDAICRPLPIRPCGGRPLLG